MKKFIESLERKRTHNVFNPWFDHDPENDTDKDCSHIRMSQLRAYLSERKNAKFLLVAEALGYQGGHFSGIPMTSERILLNKMTHKAITPEHVFKGFSPQRTSLASVKADGFTEPTATIIWGMLIDAGLDTRNFIFWNAFPWHPYKPEKGILSNRTPTDNELEEGIRVLNNLIDFTDGARIIAIGNKSQVLLNTMGIDAPKVRHPANGGATKFREQLLVEITRTDS